MPGTSSNTNGSTYRRDRSTATHTSVFDFWRGLVHDAPDQARAVHDRLARRHLPVRGRSRRDAERERGVAKSSTRSFALDGHPGPVVVSIPRHYSQSPRHYSRVRLFGIVGFWALPERSDTCGAHLTWRVIEAFWLMKKRLLSSPPWSARAAKGTDHEQVDLRAWAYRS
ncbi:hypothetical protein LI90_2209 [Carbonactinospora thermoautotrophica]|uniref:Uncharacterized protein n=1 Tax=Carbonactinospora thermoautotrophica TaxID=1469144 RepID=A0A132MTK7_9ACTN|nr:hypothetical protein LI90_2209 [Carbonactinospora thermoautotrophica]